ncbi:dihydrodipicolinate synthase family protein [Arthrobacter pigmenti]
MTNTDLGGILTALSTPFDDNGHIDYGRLRSHIDRTIDGGVDGVVVCGSTGEFAAMSPTERRELVEAVVDHVSGRVPVVAQTGAVSTAEAIELSRHAQQAGADVIMLVTPYYEPLSLEETIDYLRTVAAAVELPVMLYNMPAATGVNLDAETAGSLAREVENIRYIKDSSTNMEQALQLIHHHSDHLKTFIGWDSLIFSALSEGAAGAVAGAASVLPHELVSVHRKLAAGDVAGARAEWERIYPLIDGMISLPFISAIKSALRDLGAPIGSPRHPTADLTAEQAEGVRSLVHATKRASAAV